MFLPGVLQRALIIWLDRCCFGIFVCATCQSAAGCSLQLLGVLRSMLVSLIVRPQTLIAHGA
jgi:hypothetical protein